MKIVQVRVIATGGGAFVDPRTRDLWNNRAITVWLDAPIDVLMPDRRDRYDPDALRYRTGVGAVCLAADEDSFDLGVPFHALAATW